MATEWNEQTAERLAALAPEARETAYCPYSGFAVGAALLAESGEIYTGGNIENAAYTPSNCAERTAFFKAVSAGERKFAAIAVAGGRAGAGPGRFCAPCRGWGQGMGECWVDDFKILLVKAGAVKLYTLAQLLPESFSPDNLH